MELPFELRTAIDSELASVPTKRLAATVVALSERYRTGSPTDSRGSFLQSKEDAAAYAAFRMPATFAAVYAALKQIQLRFPDWSPKSLMDVGAGPGTASWAATAIWPDINSIMFLEQEDNMIALGKRLAVHSSVSALREAEWRKANIVRSWEVPPHDLVIASYVLGELPENERESFVLRLWQVTGDILVIIEPGTPAGSNRIRQVRERLLAEGAKTAAPCPHDKACPMPENDWCHFSQRVSRSRLHRQVKSGELSYEDEKFSFIGMSHIGGKAIQGVVLRHPQIRPGHIRLELCTPEELKSIVVTRKDRNSFKRARDLYWGSIIPADD